MFYFRWYCSDSIQSPRSATILRCKTEKCNKQFPEPLNQHNETKANKERKTHFKKLQNGLEKPPRSQNGSHSLLMRTPVTPPSVVAHQNFRMRRSYHRAPDWYRHLDLVSRITRM